MKRSLECLLIEISEDWGQTDVGVDGPDAILEYAGRREMFRGHSVPEQEGIVYGDQVFF